MMNAAICLGCRLRIAAAVVVVMVSLVVGGCRSRPPLPVYAWPGTTGALEVLAERARQVDGVAARCEITIDPPDGRGVTLEGAFAAIEQPPRFRLQAWKFDQRVLDLTATDAGVWLWADERAKDVDRFLPPAGRTTPWFGPLMEPLDPAMADVVSAGVDSGLLTVRWPLRALMAGEPEAAEGWLFLDIHRPTITIREVRVTDGEGETIQRLMLDRYELVDGVPWPGRLRATGQVDVSLRLQEVELNPTLPEGAFEPPADATQRR